MLRTRYASRLQRKALSTIDWMLSSQASDVINQFYIHRLRTADPVGGGTWQFAKRDTWEHGTRGRSQTTMTRFWLFFDHLPPWVDIFYGMNVDKKWTFLAHLPTSSCKRSLWMTPTEMAGSEWGKPYSWSIKLCKSAPAKSAVGDHIHIPPSSSSS